MEPVVTETLTITTGAAIPTESYTATFAGASVKPIWSVLPAGIGTMSSAGVFTPSGAMGGVVTLTATYGGATATRLVDVDLSLTQSGATTAPSEQGQILADPSQILTGGGVGGVGGEGLGPAPSPADVAALAAAPADDGSAKHLVYLYPYDKTVWPRGLLAPLLQWSWDDGDADAIAIELRNKSGTFDWHGDFGRPAALGSGMYIRSPIPQDVWEAATDSSGDTLADGSSDTLTVDLVVVHGGVAHGPISETWTIAPTRLDGTIYYNSYGTRLVQNSNDRDFNGNIYGAAVLGINVGDTAPHIVAGKQNLDLTGSDCRVCHTIASGGSTLLVQQGSDYGTTWKYDLSGKTDPAALSPDGTFGWAGLSHDGLLAFTNGANLSANNGSGGQLFSLAASSPSSMPTSGLPSGLQAGVPTFSADGTLAAFEFFGGSLDYTDATGAAKHMDGKTGRVVVFSVDTTTGAFTNVVDVVDGDGTHANGFATFLPTNAGILYNHQLTDGGQRYDTWHQATAQIYWSDLATSTPTLLSALNGLGSDGATSYLPTNSNHQDDIELNYEPTVLPVASGGYAWVVFTSRRIYGNVANGQPWLSDPRDYNENDATQITSKKLWVAAIDLNGKGGMDPSHPAFYLPAQELAAGNSRGFWVLSPCKADGAGCSSGDQCCGGYCGGTGEAPVCSATPLGHGCANLGDKCESSGDCCVASQHCIGGFCAVAGPS